MMDYIYLMTTTPTGERCAQIGDENYGPNSRKEASVYMAQLTRTFGENPAGTYFKLVRCEHDFGPYRDIRFYFDNENQQHVIYMSDIENGCEKWDQAALHELQRKGYDISSKSKVVPMPNERMALKVKGA